jgi:hypothetical protein
LCPDTKLQGGAVQKSVRRFNPRIASQMWTLRGTTGGLKQAAGKRMVSTEMKGKPTSGYKGLIDAGYSGTAEQAAEKLNVEGTGG